MKKKYSILFFTAIIFLLVSEYLFLTELSGTHSLLLLLASATGLLISSLVIIICYIRSANDAAWMAVCTKQVLLVFNWFLLLIMLRGRAKYIPLLIFLFGLLLIVFLQFNSSQSIGRLIDGNTSLLNELQTRNELQKLETELVNIESTIRAWQ